MNVAALPIGGGVVAVAGTLLSLVRHPHWLFRIWDFPRNALATAGALSLAAWPAVRKARAPSRAEAVFLGSVGLVTAFQAWRMRPWTIAHRRVVKRTREDARERSVRLLISNVQMENEEHARWLAAARAEDPDVILALEVNERWTRALAPLDATHPHSLKHPQENCYGIALWSRFPLVDPEVKFVVTDDVPSIHAGLVLPDGRQIRLYGLHPKPPEPMRGQTSEERDVELHLVGKEIGAAVDPRPTIVAGDLNDVAWSRTTEEFMEKSGLVDPRIGRGMYNSFNADNPLARWPLDHVFHSRDFTLTDLHRLGHVGSDHFPMLIELALRP